MDWGSGLSHTEAGTVKTLRRGKHRYKVRVVGIDHEHYSAHQLIWFWVTGEWADLIDHRDGDSLNNRWQNLRQASLQINAQNRRVALKHNKSGRLGVTTKSYGYEAKIKVNGKVTYLGTFKDPDVAH